MMIFDQYSRYRAVALACKELQSQSDLLNNSNIIDIGSGPYKLLGQFIEGNPITYVDPLLKEAVASSANETVLGLDIFKDYEEISNYKSDVVVSIDTLEHIPGEKRLDFLEKIYRLGKSGYILAFPCSDTPESGRVDKVVNDFFNQTFGEDYSWLAEHYEYGLPSAEQTMLFFQKKGLSVQAFRQGNSDWLTKILPAVIAVHEFDFLAEKVDELSAYFNEYLAQYDIAQTGYRVIVVASSNELDLSPIFPKEKPLDADLDSRVEILVRDLILNSLFPALAQLRNVRKDIYSLERKSVEIGKWGLVLQEKVAELEKKLAEQKPAPKSI